MARVAQSAAQRAFNPMVAGSTPAPGPTTNTRRTNVEDITYLLELAKPTREELFAHVAQAYQKHPDDIDLWYALRALLPSLKTVRDDFKWIAQAANPHDIRTYCTIVHSIDGCLVATDGPRIHVVTDMNMPDGFYDPKSGRAVAMTEPPFTTWRKYFDAPATIISSPDFKVVMYRPSIHAIGMQFADGMIVPYSMYLDAVGKSDDVIVYLVDAEPRCVKLVMNGGKRVAIISTVVINDED